MRHQSQGASIDVVDHAGMAQLSAALRCDTMNSVPLEPQVPQ